MPTGLHSWAAVMADAFVNKVWQCTLYCSITSVLAHGVPVQCPTGSTCPSGHLDAPPLLLCGNVCEGMCTSPSLTKERHMHGLQIRCSGGSLNAGVLHMMAMP